MFRHAVRAVVSLGGLAAMVLMDPSGAEAKKNAPKPAGFVRNLQAGTKQTVVTYGTSLTDRARWVDELREFLDERFPGLATVQNTGVGAAASVWGLANLDERVLAYKPDAVIIEFAINDAFTPYNISLKQCRDNLEKMIGRIQRANKKCEIILLTLSIPLGVHFDSRPDFEKYYDVYRDVAVKRKLRFIDTYPAWKKVLFSSHDKFFEYVPDGIHPAPKGCEMVSFPVIRASIMGETE
jgi:acyl-CoA thioesterase-1